MSASKRSIFLLGLGVLQIVGVLSGLAPLQGLAAATLASPAPKVFSVAKGLETYSTRFFLEWSDISGTIHTAEVTPEVYARLKGPYNRRNVYGAILAFGPVLYTDARARPMFDAVAEYALCEEAPILKELGLAQDAVGPIRVRYVPREDVGMGDLPQTIEVPCS